MTKKLVLFVAVLAALGVLAAACAQAPVIVYIVVTATPTTEGDVPAATTAATSDASAAPSGTPTPDVTVTAGATTDPSIIVRQIYVAEQPFQRGRMFWLEPTGQIWVMIENEPGFGTWEVYEDLFEEGDLEFDPSVVAPEGLLQPIRGFGLIWRTGQNVREHLGWATDIEVGFVSNYEYHPDPDRTAQNPGYGFHFMQNQYGEWYRFNEINRTWQSVQHTSAQPTATPTP